MRFKQQKGGQPGFDEQNRIFSEIICSPEFPQGCIDPGEN